ncbi:MAG: thioredoxin fold domain-containing protein [Chryseobacterium sp.]|nr:thioredoxin fold domain-containing protein [Candidatus Chryseobacterium enterohippi]
MKKTAILSFLFLAILAFGQGIKFEEAKFASLLEKAKKEKKLIFVDAYAVWCGPCKLMVKNIFPQQAVGDYYNAHFINTKIDMEKGEGIALAKKYNVKVFPTYLFINGDGEEVHRTIGYVEEKEFVQFAKDAEDPNKRLASLKIKFDKGEKDPEFLKNLADLTRYTDAAYTAKVLDRYFAGKSLDNLDDVKLLMDGLQNSDSPLYKIFTDKKADIIKFIPEEKYEIINKNLQLSSALIKSYNADTKTWNDAYYYEATKDLLSKEDAEKVLNQSKANRALKMKDFANYEKLTLEIYKDYSQANYQELNSIAWNFFENVKTKSSLEKALLWAQDSVKKNENSANTDTLANLYNKTGDKKNAKLWAEKAIELAKKAGEDSSETEKLLKSL